MSHIQRRRGKTGVTWRVRYIDPDGREKSRTFKRKADAETFDTEISHNLLAGSYVDPVLGRQTVKQYLEEWRALQVHHRPKSAASTRTRFHTMVYPHIGDLPIGKVKPSTIRTWQKTLLETEWAPGRTYSPSTVNGVRGQVAGAFNDAVTDRRIPANPFVGVKAPEEIHDKVVPRTVDQVRAAEDAMTGRTHRYRAAITTAAGTGMRWGELFGLTRDRLDFLRKQVRVDRQLAGRDGNTPIFGPPKTKASTRTIPLPQRVVDALAAHLARYPAEPDQLVFRTVRGGPLTRGVFGDAWIRARDAAGLQPGDGLHQLRHFYASLLIADGRSIKEVQERLGHASAQETLDTYAHLFPGSEDGTRNAIDTAFTDTTGNTTEKETRNGMG